MSRILIVDDEPMISMLVADWLSELGHETLGPSRDTASALAMIEASPPDAAIIDVSLGAESGYPVAECLANSHIPFVFATGYSGANLPPRFAGTSVLNKPFDFARVRDALNELLGGTLKGTE